MIKLVFIIVALCAHFCFADRVFVELNQQFKQSHGILIIGTSSLLVPLLQSLPLSNVNLLTDSKFIFPYPLYNDTVLFHNIPILKHKLFILNSIVPIYADAKDGDSKDDIKTAVLTFLKPLTQLLKHIPRVILVDSYMSEESTVNENFHKLLIMTYPKFEPVVKNLGLLLSRKTKNELTNKDRLFYRWLDVRIKFHQPLNVIFISIQNLKVDETFCRLVTNLIEFGNVHVILNAPEIVTCRGSYFESMDQSVNSLERDKTKYFQRLYKPMLIGTNLPILTILKDFKIKLFISDTYNLGILMPLLTLNVPLAIIGPYQSSYTRYLEINQVLFRLNTTKTEKEIECKEAKCKETESHEFKETEFKETESQQVQHLINSLFTYKSNLQRLRKIWEMEGNLDRLLSEIEFAYTYNEFEGLKSEEIVETSLWRWIWS